MASFVNFSPEEVADLLQERGICEDTTDEFIKNRVSGAAFLKLTEADLKDLVPLIGVRTEVRDILAECKEVQRFNMIGNYLGVPSYLLF